jgi:hypothetical protein
MFWNPKNWKKSTIAVSLTAIIAMSIFATIMPTKAADLNQEFVEPLGTHYSWGFEQQNLNCCQPPDGWTVSGGFRFPCTDIDGDNKTDDFDLSLFLCYYGESRYDFDGDGIETWKDLGIISKCLQTNKSEGVFEGNYSWLIGGPGCSWMERYVEASAIPGLDSQTYSFGIWYRGKVVYSDNPTVRVLVTVKQSGTEETFAGPTNSVFVDWTEAHVECPARSSIQSIKVRVELNDCECWVDCAQLSIYKNSEFSAAECKGNLGMIVYSYQQYPPPVYHEVRCMPCLYLEQNSANYYVESVTLDAKVISGPGADLKVWQGLQGNDKGYIILPQTTGAYQNGLFVLTILISTITSIGLIYGMPYLSGALQIPSLSMEGVVIRLVAGSTVSALTHYFLPEMLVSPQQTSGSEVWISLDCPNYVRVPDLTTPASDVFVQSINTMLDTSWGLKSAGSATYELQIQATVRMAQASISFVIGTGFVWSLGPPYADHTFTMTYTVST